MGARGSAVGLPLLGPYCGTVVESTTVRGRLVPKAKVVARAWAMVTAELRTLPNFLIIGTKRGGTTSLYNYLLGHPAVRSTVPDRQHIKGTYYFDVNAGERSSRWYRSHFPMRRSLAGGSITGEASPYYLYHPLAARRAAQLVPGARVIAILRDPVDRAWSHHRERVGQGFEELTFEEAIDAEQQRTVGHAKRLLADTSFHSIAHQMWSYVDQGRYLPCLLEWERWYPRDQMLVLRSEDLYSEPAAVLDRVHSFLGLGPHRLSEHRVWNLQDHQELSPAMRDRLQSLLVDDVAALERHIGYKMMWRSFS